MHQELDVKRGRNTIFETSLGKMIHSDSLTILQGLRAKSVDLVMTSPPFGLVRKKEYGNVSADEYLGWFRPFAEQIHRILKDSGSLVIDIGGAWNERQATRHLYHFKLLIMLCEEYRFHLAQEFYSWNPSKLPTPAEWVTVRRIRVKDAVNAVWWLSPSPWPKASNRRVLQPYSDSMIELLSNGYKAKKRPSGHDISTKFQINNGAAIPPNLLAIPNTESNSSYQRYCKERGLKPHPARFPAELPEFFVRMLTDTNDLVVDPFAGSCVTGEVCERLQRRWICSELKLEYLEGAIGRFQKSPIDSESRAKKRIPRRTGNEFTSNVSDYYRIPRSGVLWNGIERDRLPADGGKVRSKIRGDRSTRESMPTLNQSGDAGPLFCSPTTNNGKTG